MGQGTGMSGQGTVL